MKPISLCTFNFKVISKLLNTRLAPFLPSLISEEQSGFTKTRSITDNILLAQEIIQKIDSKVRGGNVVLKLDLTKAYDRLSWLFLIKVLRKFGFCENFIDMIWRIISNYWYSLLLNGQVGGFFSSSRGVRQGDPLSPSLFIIAAEVSSRGLIYLVQSNQTNAFSMPRGCPIVTHLSFADDVGDHY